MMKQVCIDLVGMTMKEETHRKIEDYQAEYEGCQGEPATLEQVTAAEAVLGVSFSDDYKEFLSIYGGAEVGAYTIMGLNKAEETSPFLWNVVDVTNKFIKDGCSFIVGNYVVSVDLGGSPIFVDGSGVVWIFDHDSGAVEEKAKSVEEYIVNCLS
jgi:hypothetical protein